jgi:lysozyme
MRDISRALKLIKYFEGFSPKAEHVSLGKGRHESWLTIGYGSTGGWVTPGLTITELQAEQYLLRTIAAKQNFIENAIKVPLDQNQYEAILSFAYNAVEEQFLESGFLKLLNQGQHDEALKRMLLWFRGEGRIELLGLKRRRIAEALLWKQGIVELRSEVLDSWWLRQGELFQRQQVSMIQLLDICRHYKSLPHQDSAIAYLQDELERNSPHVLTELAQRWRTLPLTPTISTSTALKPVFTFDMPLNDHPPGVLIVGVLRLHGFRGEELTFECTSGQRAYQYSGGTKMKGLGPIPGHRAVGIPHYWVRTLPDDRRGVKGIDGNAYYMTPDPVMISGVSRGEFFVHDDANRGYSPGSAGCIVAMSSRIFRRIEDCMHALREAGFKQVPLEVNH